MATVNEGHADVVVVGGGIAGACAAISAAETGADVILLERSGGTGGTSALAAGHFYLGGGTPVQIETGFGDTVQAMIDYLMAVTPDPDAEKIRAYCEDSVAHFHWLEAHGVEFERTFYPGKAVVQPGTEGLMWTGNEKVWPYREQAKPWPRGHKIAALAEKGGREVMRVMAVALEQAGVRVRCDAKVVDLLTDETGAVVGVRCRDESTVRAKAVVLATGGYVMNPEMLKTYTPVLAANALPLGTPTDDGSGILLGQSVGGALEHMGGAFMTASFYPPADLLEGIVVNAEGARFVAEDSYHGRTAAAVMRESKAYLIVDSDIMAFPELPMIKFIDGWETVAEMEAALGIPDGKLAATLHDYNEAAARGEDPVMHKHPDWLAPLDTGPWAAFHLSPPEATYVGFTLGGLRTTLDGQVCRTDGSVIGGLFAAGACASNIVQDGSGYSSGTCLGESSYFGRRAGVRAAKQTHAGPEGTGVGRC